MWSCASRQQGLLSRDGQADRCDRFGLDVSAIGRHRRADISVPLDTATGANT
jgi:hypothetical protein